LFVEKLILGSIIKMREGAMTYLDSRFQLSYEYEKGEGLLPFPR